jgi:hypothetical protein
MYGPATDVPGLLHMLRSDDPGGRERAYHELIGSLAHQGTRWQASAQAVPWLVALVDDEHTPDRAAVIEILHVIALAGLDDRSLPFDPERAFAAADSVSAAELGSLLVDPGDRDAPADIERRAEIARRVVVRWARDAYEATAVHADRIVLWLADRDPKVVAAAAALVAWFPGCASDALPALASVPAAQGWAVARASANLGLAHLAPGLPAPDVRRRLRVLLADRRYLVQLTAAIALAYRNPNDDADDLLAIMTAAQDRTYELRGILLAASARPDDLQRWSDELWWRPLDELTADALRRLG